MTLSETNGIQSFCLTNTQTLNNNTAEYKLDFDCTEHQTNPIPVRVTVRPHTGFNPNYVQEIPSGRNPSNLTIINTTKSVGSDSKKPVALYLLNARTVKNNSFVIKDYVVDNNIDILAITETWLHMDISNQVIVNNICPT